jgi:Carboxypeptidase regulatory-like domain
MRRSFLKSFVLVVVTALSLTLSSNVLAQAITTSSLLGTVLNEKNEPVAGAAVSVIHEPTGSAYATKSRPNGTFVLRGLRPGGPYAVTTEAAGFVSKAEKEVYLDIDSAANLSFRLAAEDVVKLETFKVTATATDQMFDLNKSGAGSYLINTDLRNLPGGDRSINSLARLDARISYNRDPFERAISVSGTSNRYNSIQVDGVSASDPFGLAVIPRNLVHL